MANYHVAIQIMGAETPQAAIDGLLRGATAGRLFASGTKVNVETALINMLDDQPDATFVFLDVTAVAGRPKPKLVEYVAV